MSVARLALLLTAVLMAAPGLSARAHEPDAPPPAESHSENAASSELRFAQPRPGLYTAGQPSATELAAAAQAGITTVIDLRGPDEDRGFDEPTAAAWVGLRYHALPIEGANAVTADNARQLHALIASADGPVLVHCASGNRAGALLALAAAHVEGADSDTALAFGRAAGLTSLAPVVEKQLPGSGSKLSSRIDGHAQNAADTTP